MWEAVPTPRGSINPPPKNVPTNFSDSAQGTRDDSMSGPNVIEGFSEERFVHPEGLFPEFFCLSCGCVMRRPVSVGCPTNHKMCQACCEEWFKRKRECPECRSPVNANAPTLDISLHGMIGRLTVFCANQQAGCEWQGKLEDAEEHEIRACLYRQGAIPQHQAGCPNIPAVCSVPTCPHRIADQHLADPSAACMRVMAERLAATQTELQQMCLTASSAPQAQPTRLSALLNELLDSQPRGRLPLLPTPSPQAPPRRAHSPFAPGAQPATPSPGIPPPLAGRLRVDAPPFMPAPVPRPPLPAAGRARFRAEAPPFRPRDPVPIFVPPCDLPLRDPAPVFVPPRDLGPPPDPRVEPGDAEDPRSLLDLRLWPDYAKDRYQMLLNSGSSNADPPSFLSHHFSDPLTPWFPIRRPHFPALCSIRDEAGFVHRSLDHFYFAQMAADDGDGWRARIHAAPTGRAAREVARGLRFTTKSTRQRAMRRGLLLKYSQHPELRDLLASTHPRQVCNPGLCARELIPRDSRSNAPNRLNATGLPPFQIIFEAPGSYWGRSNRLGTVMMEMRDLIRSPQDLVGLLRPASPLNGGGN
ncbi:hypothetical protein PAPYR_8092 [Paratrimastix pyriformis]|uniref:RING-type domain-containing protein n=1 Tax=Paratrimastix pyriformis TaxID=342808 RepID=A0ABQ8UBE1_9EUKA|nr:hypothetical protein PAPYR_8092 [Paratrimastix pyriformis]